MQNTLESLQIEWACAKLIYRFVRLVDERDWDAIGALFTPDGIFVRPSAPDVSIQGRDAITHHFKSRPPRFTHHLVANIVVDVQSCARATGTSVLVVHTAPETADSVRPYKAEPRQLIARFDDRFCLFEDQWRFEAHSGFLTFVT